MPSVIEKTCCMCKSKKRLNDFYVNTTKKDQRNDICMVCQLEVNKKNK